MRDPLVPPLAALAGGILVARFVRFDGRELLIAIAALLILGAASLWRGLRFAAMSGCLAGIFFTGCLTAVAHRPGPPPELDAEGPVTLTGCVVQPPALAGDRERFVLELEPGARVQVTLYVREGEQPPELQYGQRIELDAKVRRPRNFRNPGAFDYAGYLARRNIFWTASGRAGGALRRLPGVCGSTLERAAASIRVAALERIARLYPANPYNNGMMQAILIGESFQLQKVWTENFRSTGTFHALVISGTHVAVLAGAFLLLLRLCFVPRGAAALLAATGSWLYAIMTGWQAPCIRSAAGITLFMIGGYFYRERRVMNLLAAVAIGFLALDPEQLFEASFQLSFLAVGFIAAFAVPALEATIAPLARGLRDLEDRGPDLHAVPRVAQFRVEMRLLAEALRLWSHVPARASLAAIAAPARILFYAGELTVISAVVQIGLALPMVIYFHRLGFSGLSANALVVPLMGALVPMGFVAVLTGWHWTAQLAAALLAWSRAVVDWHASLEPNWRIPAPPMWLSIALVAALIAAALAGRGPKWWRAAAVLPAGLLVIVLLWHPFRPTLDPGRLEVDAIDVGQGDSILVAFPSGKLMLVDGGGIPTYGRATKPQLDIGEDVVAPYLWSRSIRHVDVLVCSHAHEDHIGGLPALLSDFHVQELWTGATPDSPQWYSLRQAALRNRVKIVPMVRGRSFAYGGTRIDVLAPSPDYIPGAVPRNNDSLALRLSFGRHSFLLTGDIERQVEEELVAGGLVGPADVLKVAHHGSKTSSTAEFLDAARPAFALLSAGSDNPYGHPHAEVLDRFAERGIRLFRTDQYGLVGIRSDGRRLTLDTARWRNETASLYGLF